MKALLPVFCRPMGYVILLVSLFLPFLFAMWKIIDDNNLLFYKECFKLLMIIGALMILLALNKEESSATERIRVTAIRRAVFLTIIFLFGGMLYRVALGDVTLIDTSSFLIFLILNVICLEFGFKKAAIEKSFKEK